MVRLCLALVLSFVLLTPQPTGAQEQETAPEAAIGTIAEIEGTVALQHGEDSALAKVGQDIFLNDIIETGPQSRALLLFIDDTELALGENARTTVDEYVFDADDPAANKGRFSVLRGAFIFTTGLIDKLATPDVAIETPYGSIGIRGTTVWGGTLEDEYSVFVEDGAVTFANDRGRVNINAGQAAAIRGRSAIPGRPARWDEERIKRAKGTTGLKNAAAVRERVVRMKERHAEMRARHRGVIQERKLQRREHLQQQREELREQRQEKREGLRDQRQERRGEIRPAPTQAQQRRRLND